ncbi:MAG: AtpZ/AtpI family protein [Pseudonocardiaceae bacterium]
MNQRDSPDLSTLLSFGITTALCLVAGLAVGWLVDELLDTLPVFTLVGLAVGIVGTCWYVYAELKKYLKE